ncbi:unnamed protein product [Prunus armeniaca]|uniref:Aminotransferase-like plant mobile domain-containing protein n=1 Tax=Prunus armeniaca TaxID=36596 RepID=A0A6J5U9Z4_PRUAR|nr:unnamed protein product [Prunus armeniaca]
MHGVVVPDHDLDYLEVQPRALRWIPRRDNDTTSVDVQKYRQRLDALNADQVIWEPYKFEREHHPFPDVEFYSGYMGTL